MKIKEKISATCRVCGIDFQYPPRRGRPSTVCPAEACARRAARDRFAGTTSNTSWVTAATCVVCQEPFTYEQRTNRRAKCENPACHQVRGVYRVRGEHRTAENPREWINGLKAEPCLDCGGTFPPECMDFDHRPGETKTGEIGELWRCAKARVVAEIAKCDLVCSNCHRIRTAARRRAASQAMHA